MSDHVTLREIVTNLLYPPRCLLCGTLCGWEELLCESCQKQQPQAGEFFWEPEVFLSLIHILPRSWSRKRLSARSTKTCGFSKTARESSLISLVSRRLISVMGVAPFGVGG